MTIRSGKYLPYAILATALISGPAIADPVQNPGNGHYYDVISGGSWNWAEARTDALGRSHEGLQGHLVAIGSEAENDFLTDDMDVPGNSWIGAYQDESGGEPADGWAWVTGEPWGFTSWGAGEPNNAGGNEECGHWWAPDGAWNDINCGNDYGSYVIEYEPGDGTARFAVTKIFTDGRTDAVDVTITCSTGLPLTQTATIAGGDLVGVTFVVTDILGGADCEITESGGPAGYIPVMNGGDGCSWDGVTGGAYSCLISNQAEPATFTAYMEWNIVNEGGEAVDDNTSVTIMCDSEITTYGAIEYDGYWYLSDVLGDGQHLTATVVTTTGPASCGASQIVTSSGVESSNNCYQRLIFAGGSDSCAFVNTVFFEGIPTLSQYGLALLALLMLGVGMVGFRRFV